MKKASEIDYSKLLGFEAIGDEIVGNVDFQDERVAAKLGAKVGVDPVTAGRAGWGLEGIARATNRNRLERLELSSQGSLQTMP